MNISCSAIITAARTSALVLAVALAACSSDAPPAAPASAAAPAATATATPAPAPAAATAASDDDAIINVPGSPLLMGLLTSPGFKINGEGMEQGKTIQMPVPVIWVFSPDGNLVRAVSKTEGLSAFSADFKATDTEGTHLTCAQLETAVQNATQSEPATDLGCAGGKWVGVVLSADHEDCTYCKEFVDTFARVAGQHTDELHATTLMLGM